jgi:hypothetical protein
VGNFIFSEQGNFHSIKNVGFNPGWSLGRVVQTFGSELDAEGNSTFSEKLVFEQNA